MPGQVEPSRARRQGVAFRVGVAAAVVAGMAILAGTAGLAVSAASRSADPRLSPSVTGQWQVSASTLIFNPDTQLAPSTRFTLRIPAGPAGMMSAAGGLLAKPVTTHFRTAAYSQLRLAELLSDLDYLPLAWQPGAGGRLSSDPTRDGEMSQQEQAYSPPAGSFTWQAGYPASLRGQWRPDRPNPLVRGAVMAFKAQHRMAINADTTGKFWDQLFAAADAGQRSKFGYTHAVASKGSPSTTSRADPTAHRRVSAASNCPTAKPSGRGRTSPTAAWSPFPADFLR